MRHFPMSVEIDGVRVAEDTVVCVKAGPAPIDFMTGSLDPPEAPELAWTLLRGGHAVHCLVYQPGDAVLGRHVQVGTVLISERCSSAAEARAWSEAWRGALLQGAVDPDIADWRLQIEDSRIDG